MRNWTAYWIRLLVQAFQEAALNQPILLFVLLVLSTSIAIAAAFVS